MVRRVVRFVDSKRHKKIEIPQKRGISTSIHFNLIQIAFCVQDNFLHPEKKG